MTPAPAPSPAPAIIESTQADIAVAATGLARRYGRVDAVADVTVGIRRGAVTGLIGRNGAGKTTLLRMIAGHERPTSGAVRVLGGAPFENADIARRVVLVREDQRYPDFAVGHVLDCAARAMPRWDANLCAELMDAFGVPKDRKPKRLSRGMRSALGIVIGFASGAEVTMFDEPVAGLDSVAREVFYDALLRQAATAERAIVVSTHLIDEIALILEDVVIVDRGSVVAAGPAEEVAASWIEITGPPVAVDRVVRPWPHGPIEILGGQSRVVVKGETAAQQPTAAQHPTAPQHPTAAQIMAAAREQGLRVETLGLQQVLRHLDLRGEPAVGRAAPTAPKVPTVIANPAAPATSTNPAAPTAEANPAETNPPEPPTPQIQP